MCKLRPSSYSLLREESSALPCPPAARGMKGRGVAQSSEKPHVAAAAPSTHFHRGIMLQQRYPITTETQYQNSCPHLNSAGNPSKCYKKPRVMKSQKRTHANARRRSGAASQGRKPPPLQCSSSSAVSVTVHVTCAGSGEGVDAFFYCTVISLD